MDDPDMAVEALKDCCDIISYGRPLLADAEFAEKVRTGRTDETYHVWAVMRAVWEELPMVRFAVQ